MAGAQLDPGEELRVAAGFSALIRLLGGAPGRPLVVFVTGGGVLARVAYGHGDARPEDFLAYWLHRAGYSFLATSYPLGHPVFPQAYPAFTVRDWAAQTAELARSAVVDHGLAPRILVLAWSMAGRIAQPLGTACRERGLEIELFLPMAATPALPNLLPALDALRPDPQGLADARVGFFPWLVRCLQAQNERAGRSILAEEEFLAAFTGDYPINLAATPLRYRDGRFVADIAEDDQDTGARNIAEFPCLAVLGHDSPLDPRHALTDRANWAAFLAQSLFARVSARAPDLAALPPEAWRECLRLIHGASERLSATVPGSHLFFLGESGAQATVAALGTLQDRARTLTAELDRLAKG